MLCNVYFTTFNYNCNIDSKYSQFYPNNFFMDLIVAYKGNTLFGSIGINDETEPTSSGSNSDSGRYFSFVLYV